jgi:hypothetical protein
MNEWMSYFQTLLTEDRGDLSEDEGLEHSNTGLQIALDEIEDVLKKGKMVRHLHQQEFLRSC